MARHKPPPPVIWDAPRGVFLIGDHRAPPPARSLFTRPAAAKRPPEGVSRVKAWLLAIAFCTWVWAFGPIAVHAVLELLR